MTKLLPAYDPGDTLCIASPINPLYVGCFPLVMRKHSLLMVSYYIEDIFEWDLLSWKIKDIRQELRKKNFQL